MSKQMKYVYFLQSIVDPDKRYIGQTMNLKSRLKEHNAGKSIHTNKHKPWKLIAYMAFDDEGKAFAFERYLKHGSGHAFAKKHFW